MLSSTPFPVTIAHINPGVFAMNGGGQGDAAALSSSYALINQLNPAGVNATGSDTIELYVTALGEPDSDGTAVSWPASATTCMAATGSSGYFTLENAAAIAAAGLQNASPPAALTSDDGLVLQSTVFPAATPMAPCFLSTSSHVPIVTIGGVAGTVSYAGWVPGSVVGLYQINVTLPSTTSTTFQNSDGTTATVNATTPAKLPIVVSNTGGTITSQPSGVNLWVVQSPVVAVANPSFVVNTLLSGTSVPNPFTVTGGSGNYTFTADPTALDGIVMDSATGNLSGTPTATGTFPVTVTVTDTTTHWVGTVSLTITVTIG